MSGEGGDELFFGYGSHIWAKRLNNSLLLASKPLIKKILKTIPSSRYKRISHLFDFEDSKHIQQHIFSQEQYYFSPKEIDALLFENSGSSNLEIDFSAQRKLTAMEKQALFDIKYYLPDDLLTKVDRASMFYSLETRVPYLDHRIVELALNISPALKYKDGVSKYILKEILYQYIPKEIFDRPKQGFAIPLAKWLKTDLSYLITDYLNKTTVEKYSVVNYKEVHLLIDRFNNGEEYLYNRIWLLILLHYWMAKNEA